MRRPVIGGISARMIVLIAAMFLACAGIWHAWQAGIWQGFLSRGSGNSQVDDSGMEIDDQRRLRAFAVIVRDLRIGDTVDQAVEQIERASAESSLVAGAHAVLSRQLETKLAASRLGPGMVKTSDRAIVISLPSDVLFEKNSPGLSPGASSVLREIASGIEQFGDDFDVEVSGHTSPREPGNRAGKGFTNDWVLSASQAGVVVTELLNRGVRAKNIKAAGFADTRPLFPRRKPDGALDRESERRNRRIEIALKVPGRKAG